MSYAPNGNMYIRGQATTLSEMTFVADTYWIGDINPWSAGGFHNDNNNGTFGPNTFNRLRFNKLCSGMDTANGQVGIPANHSNPDSCTRHNGGGVILFADGHAKWENWKAMRHQKADFLRKTP